MIATDRRTKSEPILVKLFGIGIYNALLGQDRSTANVCTLLNKPRSKKEAKIYYKIESDEVNYKSESEENVSEAEIKNILNHYRRLGKDEDRYIESFNNIAAQYNDAQLRIITKFLPLNVKAVLEEKSPKYQSVMTFGDAPSTINAMKKQKEEDGLKIGFLNNSTSNRPVKPVIVPTAIKKVATKKMTGSTGTIKNKAEEKIETNTYQEETTLPGFENVNETQISEPTLKEEPEVTTVKRGRGRPKKVVVETEQPKENTVKRGRGRPKKVVAEITPEPETILPGFDDVESKLDSILPGFDNEAQDNAVLPGFDKVDDEQILPGFDAIDNNDEDMVLPETENNNTPITNYNSNINYDSITNVSGALSKDKKVVSFVGTTKNGTSFLVNNVAK